MSGLSRLRPFEYAKIDFEPRSQPIRDPLEVKEEVIEVGMNSK